MVILLRGRGNLHSVYRSGAGVARRRDVSKSAKVSAKTSTVTGTCFTFSGCLSSRPQSILGVQLRVCHADADALICWLSSAGSHLLWLVTRWLPLAAQRRTRKGRPRDVELRISKQTTSKTVCLSIALLPDAERRDDITTFNRDSIDTVDRATERQRPTRRESTTALREGRIHDLRHPVEASIERAQELPSIEAAITNPTRNHATSSPIRVHPLLNSSYNTHRSPSSATECATYPDAQTIYDTCYRCAFHSCYSRIENHTTVTNINIAFSSFHIHHYIKDTTITKNTCCAITQKLAPKEPASELRRTSVLETRSAPGETKATAEKKEETAKDGTKETAKDAGKEKIMVRRTLATRNLKEKEEPAKPQRGTALRSSARLGAVTGASSAASTRETAVAGTTAAGTKTLPTRTLRPRNPSVTTTTSSGTTASAVDRTRTLTSRPRPSVSVPAPTRKPRPASYQLPTASQSTDPSPPTSSSTSAPRKLSLASNSSITSLPAAATAAGSASTSTTSAAAHRRALSTTSAPPRPPTSASNTSLTAKRRPAFSTLQQSFSPAPAPAPSRRSLPPPPLDQSTVHHQSSLLSHTLLFSPSHATYASLTASATAKLKRRFDSLAREHTKSREQLARRQRVQDLKGLGGLIDQDLVGGAGIGADKRTADEKIQGFSESIKKLEGLQGGEYLKLTGRFGEWISGYSAPTETVHDPQASNSESATSQGDGSSADDGSQDAESLRSSAYHLRHRWVDGLGEDWRRATLFLTNRIEGCIKSIESVVSAVMMEEGVIALVSERWLEIAKGMAEECQGMLVVERQVVTRERRALGEVVARAGGLDGDAEREQGERKGVWARETAAEQREMGVNDGERPWGVQHEVTT
ncbi:hypothetical protein BZA77DRAFT_293304 [Pyronema omphalodes]|nr:hypothetical protein BZA77DRAFT_293304 [Pyronema omphalodes]